MQPTKTDLELRLDCLRLAAETTTSRSLSDVVRAAQSFYEWMTAEPSHPAVSQGEGVDGSPPDRPPGVLNADWEVAYDKVEEMVECLYDLVKGKEDGAIIAVIDAIDTAEDLIDEIVNGEDDWEDE